MNSKAAVFFKALKQKVLHPIFLLSLAFVFVNGCLSKQSNKKPKPIVDYVNTFIGTGGHGHTYPGATLPFGMVQLSPHKSAS